MDTQALNGKLKFEKLGRYYVFALCTVALSIILSEFVAQKYLREQVSAAHWVNLSGRQRMLGQQISKLALLIGTDTADREKYVREFPGVLKAWKKAQQNLRKEYMHPKGTNVKDETLYELFGKVENHFQGMVAGAEGLLNQLRQNPYIPADRLAENINQILTHEGQFLEGMEKIVFSLDHHASTQITHLKNLQILLFVLSMIILLFGIFGVFLPSARKIQHAFREYTDAVAKSRKIALETSALYTSLEQAYQDLLEVEVAVEDFTVYAKCSPEGTFSYYSDTFDQVMEFEGERPKNLYDWLEGQGYNRAYLNNIKAIALSGQPWNGEIKVVNTSGDFIWLNFNVVPVFNDAQAVETLMIICTNETEKKEAEVISREINKEKIAHKVKEQQFRSALILEGQEEERKRISRDMHDGIGQLLSAMKFNLEAIHSVRTEFEQEKLKTLKELLRKVIMEVRRISFNLTPSALSDYGIVPVLNKFCREVSRISDLQVNFENKTGFLSRLEGKVENNLYRIVQEGVNNAIKYAEAKEVNVIISHNAQYLNLEISDDGKGFDVQKLEEKGYFSASGHGIFNIKERANFIAAQCTIASEVGNGTRISISVPLR